MLRREKRRFLLNCMQEKAGALDSDSIRSTMRSGRRPANGSRHIMHIRKAGTTSTAGWRMERWSAGIWNIAMITEAAEFLRQCSGVQWYEQHRDINDHN